MKHVIERRPHLQPLLVACMVAALVLMGTTMAGAATIDFETPSLNGADQANISPLEIQGVRFTGFSTGFLIQESAYDTCLSATNQAYQGWTSQFGCIEGCCPSQLILIEFPGPPAEPVTHLSLEARSYSGPLYLWTYDADGHLVAASIDPPSVACSMSIRGTLEVSTARPIVSAEIWSGNRPPPECDGCCTFGSTIVIDNVTFDNGQVPTTPVTWGSIKARYP
jgi:hypothetical protein